MFFSKKGAKVLAIASTFAFVLTGMSVVPGKAQAAADQAPTVKVLGATLRLDDNNGTQSLRFGIRVNNASNAEACGIDLGYKGKTITVATDVEDGAVTKKNTTLYSKDSDNDTIVYSAVITGIPSNCYENDFSVKGYVKDKIDNINKGESIEVKKSVSKVVDALKKQYPDMGLELDTDTGKLMKKNADGVLAAVEAKDFGKDGNGNADIVPEGAAELDLLNDYVQMAGSTLKPVRNEDGSVKFEDADGFTGVLYKIPYSLKSQEKVHVTVEYECTGCTAEKKTPSKEARAYLNEGNSDNRRSDDTLVGSVGHIEGDLMVKEGMTADVLHIKADSWNTSFASLTIKKITVAAVEVTAPVEKPVTGFNEDGTMYTLPINKDTVVTANPWQSPMVSLAFNEAYNAVTISKPEKDNREYGIRLPEEIYKKYDFCKAIITYKDSTNADNCGYVAKYNTNEMNYAPNEESHHGWNMMQGEGTAEVVPNNCYGSFSGFRIFDGTAGSSITITSVVFVKADESARPTPTPEPVDDEPEELEKGQVSLKKSSSYLIDGETSTAAYNHETKMLDVELSTFQGIIIKNPVEKSEYSTYKYVTVEYKLTGDKLDGYIFDGQMGNDGKGQAPAGQMPKNGLTATDDFKKITYSAEDSLYGIKLVRMGGSSKVSLTIKSITFSETDPSAVTP